MAQFTVQQAFEQALRYQQAGQLREAENLYRQIIALQPTHAGALHYLGLALHQQGQDDLAAEFILKSISIDRKVAEAHNSLGVTLQAKGLFKDAIAAFKNATTIKPNYANAYYNLGNALNDDGRPDEAIAAYRQAIAHNPKFLKAHRNLGDALMHKGQYDAATIAYGHAIGLKPDEAETYYSLGNALKKIGRAEEAIATWRKAIALTPGPTSRSPADTSPPYNVIIPPYHGEFGSLLIRHVRFVHELRADAKLVCCRRGQEMFYPTASGFVYEWEDPGADVSVPGDGPKGKAPHRDGYIPVDPVYRTHEPWKKFKPIAAAKLPAVDVALGVRLRLQKYEVEGREPSRNWSHWEWLTQKLREAGFTLGLVGHPSSSQDLEAQVRAWDHPDGFNAGSIDLLDHCRVYVGTDTGTTHLAAFCDTPTIGFRINTSGVDWMIYDQAMTRGPFIRLPHSDWDNPQAVLSAILTFLKEPRKR